MPPFTLMRLTAKTYLYMHMHIHIGAKMAKVISLSNEVYAMLVKIKGAKSFSEVIKEAMEGSRKNGDIMALFGALNNDARELKKAVYKDRAVPWR